MDPAVEPQDDERMDGLDDEGADDEWMGWMTDGWAG
jgi:hypothetical protein